MTFDVLGEVVTNVYYRWQRHFEAFCVCRQCSQPTIFSLLQRDSTDEPILKEKGLSGLRGSANAYVDVEGYVSLKDTAALRPPEFVPANIRAIFQEGATCMAVQCFNAAGTMFRLCLDLVTRDMLPKEEVEGLNAKTRRDLGLRLPWLFDNGRLPGDLRNLSHSVKEDGNDGAHAGTLGKEDAEDLADFTFELLERIYTEPERVKLAEKRREERRAPKKA